MREVFVMIFMGLVFALLYQMLRCYSNNYAKFTSLGFFLSIGIITLIKQQISINLIVAIIFSIVWNNIIELFVIPWFKKNIEALENELNKP